jgi:2-polyprenyl-3-methyl-5-hydroxy-6-metoxy-1,4-benzoquinol methylase
VPRVTTAAGPTLAEARAAIAALDPPYASVLEVGCSIGVLTPRLAEHAERLLAIHVAEAPPEEPRARVPGVTVERREIPRQWPDGAFDLIVCSEVLSHLDPPALAETRRQIERTLVPGGSLLAIHRRQRTDEIHDALRELGWPATVELRTPGYVLHRFDRP